MAYVYLAVILDMADRTMPAHAGAAAGATYRITGTTHKDITLSSAEGYEIYYLLDADSDASLPEDGKLYTGPIPLEEGGHTIRAVAITNELVSDEIIANYTISLPIPEAPKSSLAPGDYTTRQRVWLRYNGDDPENITIYYTIDGQSPTSNSPIYTGDPIILPGGRSIHIKAVAVNQYGKVSNEMDVEVGVSISFKRYFNSNDKFSSFEILKTSQSQFQKIFGEPESSEEIDDYMRGNCLKLNYEWGEARFVVGNSGYTLYYIDTSDSGMTGPRNTKVGMTETEVTEKFRDMGQLNNQNGDRSIYWDAKEGYAKLYHDDSHHDHIDYVNYTEDSGRMTLRYMLTDGVVTRILMWYEAS